MNGIGCGTLYQWHLWNTLYCVQCTYWCTFEMENLIDQQHYLHWVGGLDCKCLGTWFPGIYDEDLHGVQRVNFLFSNVKVRFASKNSWKFDLPLHFMCMLDPPIEVKSTLFFIALTFVAPILFRPDVSTAVPHSRMLEVSKSQEFHDSYEYNTLKR